MTGELVQIFDEDDPFTSDTTLLVASLLTLGIPPAGRELLHFTTEHVRGSHEFRAVWTLRGESKCSRFDTLQAQKAWNDPVWLLNNTTHPVAILRTGLTYQRAFSYAPKFTLRELAMIETPDTWLEAAMRNLIFLLREIPKSAQMTRGIVRFGLRHAAFVPQHLPEDGKTRLIKHAEDTKHRVRV